MVVHLLCTAFLSYVLDSYNMNTKNYYLPPALRTVNIRCRVSLLQNSVYGKTKGQEVNYSELDNENEWEL